MSMDPVKEKSEKKRKTEENINRVSRFTKEDAQAALLLYGLRTMKLYLEADEEEAHKRLKTEADPVETRAGNNNSHESLQILEGQNTLKKSKNKDNLPKLKAVYDNSDQTLKMLQGFKLQKVPTVAGIGADVMKICSEPFWKQLTASDVLETQSRLGMKKQAVVELLFPLLNDGEVPDKIGIDVSVFGPDGKEFNMKFKSWADQSYVLNAGWKDFYLHYGLKKYQDFIMIWMFRHRETNKICFVIVPKRFPIFNSLSSRILKEVFGSPKKLDLF